MSGGRRLTSDEKALWEKVLASVDPLKPQKRPKDTAKTPQRPTPKSQQKLAAASVDAKADRDAVAMLMQRGMQGSSTSNTYSAKAYTPEGRYDAIPISASRKNTAGLDGHWDRRLSKGAIIPDVTIDLHGHSLSSAHARLDHALAASISAGHRAILLITGKERSAEERRREGGRGAIRAAVADWLSMSRHAAHIAAVRRAHPRHGGGGALYIILRRNRG